MKSFRQACPWRPAVGCYRACGKIWGKSIIPECSVWHQALGLGMVLSPTQGRRRLNGCLSPQATKPSLQERKTVLFNTIKCFRAI